MFCAHLISGPKLCEEIRSWRSRSLVVVRHSLVGSLMGGPFAGHSKCVFPHSARQSASAVRGPTVRAREATADMRSGRTSCPGQLERAALFTARKPSSSRSWRLRIKIHKRLFFSFLSHLFAVNAFTCHTLENIHCSIDHTSPKQDGSLRPLKPPSKPQAEISKLAFQPKLRSQGRRRQSLISLGRQTTNKLQSRTPKEGAQLCS